MQLDQIDQYGIMTFTKPKERDINEEIMEEDKNEEAEIQQDLKPAIKFHEVHKFYDVNDFEPNEQGTQQLEISDIKYFPFEGLIDWTSFEILLAET